MFLFGSMHVAGMHNPAARGTRDVLKHFKYSRLQPERELRVTQFTLIAWIRARAQAGTLLTRVGCLLCRREEKRETKYPRRNCLNENARDIMKITVSIVDRWTFSRDLQFAISRYCEFFKHRWKKEKNRKNASPCYSTRCRRAIKKLEISGNEERTRPCVGECVNLSKLGATTIACLDINYHQRLPLFPASQCAWLCAYVKRNKVDGIRDGILK